MNRHSFWNMQVGISSVPGHVKVVNIVVVKSAPHVVVTLSTMCLHLETRKENFQRHERLPCLSHLHISFIPCGYTTAKLKTQGRSTANIGTKMQDPFSSCCRGTGDFMAVDNVFHLRPHVMLASLTALGTRGLVLVAGDGGASKRLRSLNPGYFMHIFCRLIGASRVAFN